MITAFPQSGSLSVIRIIDLLAVEIFTVMWKYIQWIKIFTIDKNKK